MGFDASSGNEGKRAALYGRQSKGLKRSVDEQFEDGRFACSDHRWSIWREYHDTISASPFAKKVRTDWPELLRDLAARRFDILVLWEASRGDRTAETWLGMLRVAADQGVLIYVVSDETLYDPRRDSDWKALADAGIDSELESRKTSKRIRRHLAKAAMKGLPLGPPSYGLERVFDPRTKAFVTQRPIPDQAELVREMFHHAARSYPITDIYLCLDELGIPSPKGKSWSHATVRNILTNPAYIGRRWHGDKLIDAQWEPIVDEETFWKVQRILRDPARQKFRPGRPRYLMSYILQSGCRYGLAQGKMQDGTKLLYVCQRDGCSRIEGEPVDKLVRNVILKAVTREGFYEELTRGTNAAAMEGQADVERLRAELEDFYDLAGSGRLSAEALARVEATRLPALEEARQRVQRLAAPPALLHLLEPGADALARWQEMPLAGQREVVRLLFEEVLLERRNERPKLRFSPQRIHFVWRKEFAGFA